MAKPVHQQRQATYAAASLFSRHGLLILLALLIFLGVILPWFGISSDVFVRKNVLSKWKDYNLAEAAAFVGGSSGNGTVIICIVSYPYMDFLRNWLISVARFGHSSKVLVVAEDYETLEFVNLKWPGHSVLIPPALENVGGIAHKFGSQVLIFYSSFL